MANTGFKGIDVRQTANELVFRAALKDSLGNDVTSGATTLTLLELQSDGSFKTFDTTSGTFKTSGVSTDSASMTHQTYAGASSSTKNSGVWTSTISGSPLTNFTAGGVYVAKATNTSASPISQEREFQFGSGEGDLAITSAGHLPVVDTITNAVTVGGYATNEDPATLLATQFTAIGSPMQAGTPVALATSQPNYAPSKAGDAMTLTSAYDLYHADIQFTRKTTPTATDEYTVTFFKNGVRQTSGITGATIEVAKREDGTDLVATTSLTAIGSTGSYKHDETANRLVPPDAALVIVNATISATAMAFSRLVGRDA